MVKVSVFYPNIKSRYESFFYGNMTTLSDTDVVINLNPILKQIYSFLYPPLTSSVSLKSGRVTTFYCSNSLNILHPSHLNLPSFHILGYL